MIFHQLGGNSVWISDKFYHHLLLFWLISCCSTLLRWWLWKSTLVIEFTSYSRFETVCVFFAMKSHQLWSFQSSICLQDLCSLSVEPTYSHVIVHVLPCWIGTHCSVCLFLIMDLIWDGGKCFIQDLLIQYLFPLELVQQSMSHHYSLSYESAFSTPNLLFSCLFCLIRFLLPELLLLLWLCSSSFISTLHTIMVFSLRGKSIHT